MSTNSFVVRLTIVFLIPAALVDGQANEPRARTVLRQIWNGADLGRNYGNNSTPSPDGAFIAFNERISSDQLSTTGLGIRDIAAGTNRVITPISADDRGMIGAIAWSADGQRLAYSWYSLKDAGNSNQMRMIGLDGSSMRVFDTGSAELDLVAWEPGGKEVLTLASSYEGNAFVERLAWISTVNGTMRAVKQLPEQFAHAQRWASLSPDGKYVAYSRTQSNSGNRDIFTVSADGMHETLLVTHAADDFVMGWSSDSRRLLFASNRNGTTDLWRIDVLDGKAAGIPQRLKRDLGQVEPMGIHGRTLYYRFGEFLTDSYEATVDPVTGKLLGTPSPIGTSFGGSFSSPDWSPDGRRVVHIVLPAAFGQPPSERSQQTPARLFVLSPETGRRNRSRLN